MPQKSLTVDAVNELVDAWFAECIAQPPLSHSVESYNQAHVARDELRRRLAALVRKGTDAPEPPTEGDAAPPPESGANAKAKTKSE